MSIQPATTAEIEAIRPTIKPLRRVDILNALIDHFVRNNAPWGIDADGNTTYQITSETERQGAGCAVSYVAKLVSTELYNLVLRSLNLHSDAPASVLEARFFPISLLIADVPNSPDFNTTRSKGSFLAACQSAHDTAAEKWHDCKNHPFYTPESARAWSQYEFTRRIYILLDDLPAGEFKDLKPLF